MAERGYGMVGGQPVAFWDPDDPFGVFEERHHGIEIPIGTEIALHVLESRRGSVYQRATSWECTTRRGAG